MLGVAALSPPAGAGVVAFVVGVVAVALLLGALALVSGVAVLALLLGVAALGEVAPVLDWLISLEVLEVLAAEDGGVAAPEVPVELEPQ